MAPRVIFLFFSVIFLYLPNTSHSQIDKLQAFLQPVVKDKTTNLYYTSLSIGAKELNGRSVSPIDLNFAIDLNSAAPVLLTCATAAKSPSYHPIRCGSTRCKYASPESFCPRNTIKMAICGKYVSFKGASIDSKLIRDTVSLGYTTNGVSVMDSSKDSSLTLTCADDLISLPSVVSGTIGLAKTHLSFPSQLFSMHSLQQKMALCLPSKPGKDSGFGDLFIGGGPYFFGPFPKDVSTIFSSTPLITKPSGVYFIDLKSILIGGKVLPLDKSILNARAKFSTFSPYTVLRTSIYKALVTAFTDASKMVKAPAVKPFGACFISKGLGRGVPVIDLVLDGGAKWRIYGSNSLVKVNKDVACLGFVDGGVDLKTAIVIGGYQMEDNLVEFDLKASKFSFTSSLLVHNTSCNHPSRLF